MYFPLLHENISYYIFKQKCFCSVFLSIRFPFYPAESIRKLKVLQYFQGLKRESLDKKFIIWHSQHGHLGQVIQEWTKQNLWKKAFEKFYLVQS